MSENLIHPGWYLLQEIKARGWTQKQFSDIIGKKISELNELINGKRNITVQWDILLAAAFGDPEGKRIHMQNQYDLYRFKITMDKFKLDEIKKKVNSDKNKHSNDNKKNLDDKEDIFYNF